MLGLKLIYVDKKGLPMTYICDSEMGHHWFSLWFDAYSVNYILWNNTKLLSIWPSATISTDVETKTVYLTFAK